jgi:hypothetical protein
MQILNAPLLKSQTPTSFLVVALTLASLFETFKVLLLLLCKFGRLRKLCLMTQCFWQCFHALQLRISAGMAIISDSVNNNRTSPTM